MKPEITVGMRWARIECIKVTEREFEEFESEYGTSVEIRRRVYVLRCDCGKQLERKVNEWPGKRAVPDCGCGISDSREGKEAALVYMPLPMARAAKQAAREKGNGLSQWIRDQIQKGLDEHNKRNNKKPGQG